MEHVVEQIRECDRMYCKAYKKTPSGVESNICKSLLDLGIKVTGDNLPYLCINYCSRWDLACRCLSGGVS